MSPVKILVADDSATVRTQVGRALSDAGYEVLLAPDGREALRLVKHDPPTLVILDIQMPGLDGYGVCQQLKQMGPPWDQMPIVFLTITRSHALELLGSALGAYLPKPVNVPRLLETVAGFLSNEQPAEPVTSGAWSDATGEWRPA